MKLIKVQLKDNFLYLIEFTFYFQFVKKQSFELTFIIKNDKIIINWNFTENRAFNILLFATYYSNGPAIF